MPSLSVKVSSDKKRHGILPGFKLTMGITVFYLSIMVLIPLISLIIKAAGIEPAAFTRQLLSPRVLSAFSVSIRASVYAAIFDGIFG
ncbi:MAG: sulfate ABC transporter permease subunit CysT, partial [Fibrobacter sp.]|nr:sulfate ABC transporter permease subunit CysT [Fibrobacter sp.]